MELTVAERLTLVNTLANTQGNLVTLRVVSELQAELGFSDAEVKDFDLRQEGNGYRWRENAPSKDIPINDTALKVIKAEFKKKDTAGEITLQLLPLAERFL